MLCGSNTNLYRSCLDDASPLKLTEAITRLHAAGFRSIDLTLSNVTASNFILAANDWQHQIDEVAETAAKLGMVFSQLHLPFWPAVGCPKLDRRYQTPGFAERYEEATRRAYLAGGMIGIPWAVAHPMSDSGNVTHDHEIYLATNHDYYDKYVELGVRHGVGTAFENMIQGISTHPKRRFGATCDDLLSLVDSYNDSMVQVCWDFGHANLSRLDQPSALLEVGKRLKCVHVHDNYGVFDNHFIPFVGNLDWPAIIDALVKIGYEGEMSLEIGNMTAHAPRAVHDSIARCAHDTCAQLVQMFGQMTAQPA